MRMSRTIRFCGVAVAAIALNAGAAIADEHSVHVQTPSTHTTSTHVRNTTTNSGKPSPQPFIQRIDANPKLVARLQPLLPSGMTLDQAADGFKNQGQFIAALHVAKNLNIPFAQLKSEMTGPDHDSLGQAIREINPTADSKAAVHTAEKEAKADLKATRPPKPPETDHDADDVK